MSGWRFVTAVADGQPLSVEGLNPWEHEWRRVPDAVAKVRDPAYDQPFGFSVYEIGPAERPIRFAAGEFSNCIWGFYIPD